MIDEFRKSINSTLYQRVTSPLYGTLVLTWLIWNWEIWYLTLFISEDKLHTDKVKFIVCNYSDPLYLVYLPLISTILILTVTQFISNGAFWLDLKFKTWRINTRNSVEGKQLLTLEQSIRLRSEIREQEQNFDKLLEKKNNEIDLLNKQVTELQNQISGLSESKDYFKEEIKELTSESTGERKAKGNKSKEKLGNNYSTNEYSRLTKNKELFDKFENVVKHIRDKNIFPQDISENIKEYFIANELAQSDYDSYGNPIFKLTYRGRELYKEYYNRKYIE